MALRRAYEMLELMVREVYERRFHEPPGTRPLENPGPGGLPSGPVRSRRDDPEARRAGTAQRDEVFTPGDVHQALAQLTEILKWYMEEDKPELHVRHPAAAPRSDPETQIAVVPKGLRSFDADDSDFFLQLLPGPRDKDGLPRASASGNTASRPGTIRRSPWA